MSASAPPAKASPVPDVAADATCSALPRPSVKVATARSTWPTCTCPGVNDAPAAPAMSVHVAPLFDEDCHCQAKVSGRPFGSIIPTGLAVMVSPSVGVASLSVGAPLAATLTNESSPSAKRSVSTFQSLSSPSDTKLAPAGRLAGSKPVCATVKDPSALSVIV